MSINERIKKLRKELGMNQIEFSSKLGITQPSLSDIEKGKTLTIDERNIKLICKEFNANEEWLRTGEGEIFNSFEEDFITALGMSMNSLDDMDKKFIFEFIKLQPSQREVMKKFIKSLLE